MPKSRIQRVEDPVHGLMEFEGLETVVIEALRIPEIQRLRRIRQNGLAHFVYPGAEHSRFVHSLGAAHLAIRFGKHLKKVSEGVLVHDLQPDPSSICDFAVAALCHDLGHGPLSHAWEREIVGSYDYDKWINVLGLKDEAKYLKNIEWHELVTYALLAWEDGQLHKLLERYDKNFSKRIRMFLRGYYFLEYMPGLLLGDVEVDRADYIKRDAFQSGAGYRYDLEWLLSTCSVGFYQDRKIVVGFDAGKAVWVVEDFLKARYNLYENVYYHRAVRSAEGMVALFLRRFREILANSDYPSLPSFVQPLVKMIAGEAVDQSQILMTDDYSIWVLIQYIAGDKRMDETLRDLGNRILSRDLFKLVRLPNEDMLQSFLNKPEAYTMLYDVIRPFCRGKPEYYLVVDEIKQNILSQDEIKRGYFIYNENKACPMKDHPVLNNMQNKNRNYVRIFTLNEAVESVSKLIMS